MLGTIHSLSFIWKLVLSFGVARLLAVGLLSFLIFVRVLDPGPVELLRLKVFDFYQQLKPRLSIESPVVIVDIDEASLTEYGQWPWPRTLVADLVSKISASGSAAIGMDVIFAEHDRTSPAHVAERYVKLSPSARAELNGAPDHDELMADVIARSRVVLGESTLIDAEVTPDLSEVPPTSYASLGGDPNPFLLSFPSLLPNIPVLEKAAAGRGMLTIKPDIDGIIRRIPLVMLVSERVMPALALDLLRVASGKNGILIKLDQSGITSIVLSGIDIPTDRHARLWIYFSPHDSERYISAKDIMSGRIDQNYLAGKLALVGTSASGLFDNHATPLEAAMPGVEIHAQAIENILTGSFLHQPYFIAGSEILATIVVSLAIIILMPVLGPLMVLGLGAFVSSSAVAASWYMFDVERILVDVSFPFVTTFSVFLLLAFFNYYRDALQKQQVRDAFSQYLSPALVEELADNPERLTLGGQSKELSVLFSDVRGFTTISESFSVDPQGLTRLMNRFLTPLSNAIIDEKGTIDKYMGDAVMAFWNAPLDDLEHAEHACAAGLEMLEQTRLLNIEMREQAERNNEIYRPLIVGVGINTGECVVGNMGSEIRFDYSALGDAVNLASRLEGQTKDYGVRAIIGSNTADQVSGRFAILDIDIIRVKGKEEPVKIFALLGDHDLAISDAFIQLIKSHHVMLEHYRTGNFSCALRNLQICRKVDELQLLADYYDMLQVRIEGFVENPPMGEWNGVFIALRK